MILYVFLPIIPILLGGFVKTAEKGEGLGSNDPLALLIRGGGTLQSDAIARARSRANETTIAGQILSTGDIKKGLGVKPA
jgi:hypothetical protein